MLFYHYYKSISQFMQCCHKDPVRYSFAHGGKDGYPYPVDKETYDKTIDFLRKAVHQAKVGVTEKIRAFKRLDNVVVCRSILSHRRP
ncbi:MAG: DUF763 domain-containing protein [Deltaproteobacteria bacterium]|nr:DUF763 domain-containing protein [Deltaproteobacteria bacterium]